MPSSAATNRRNRKQQRPGKSQTDKICKKKSKTHSSSNINKNKATLENPSKGGKSQIDLKAKELDKKSHRECDFCHCSHTSDILECGKLYQLGEASTVHYFCALFSFNGVQK